MSYTNFLDKKFVKSVEEAHFRTVHDTGAHPNALMVWNIVRKHVGMPAIELKDFPAWCETHKRYHVINKDYGCKTTDVSCFIGDKD
jgi:hypothetical protein